ncbi:MAG: hypothetical protein HYW26_02750 [Candidatus Aenigmarchaeota archaeon]|nr:hypothetical protein [Candidatus Aenigmarchaeota archaeon]
MPLFADDAEKKIARLEREMNRRMQRMEESFSIMKDTIIKLKKENIELKSDRDFLLERYKDILRKLPSISEPVKESIVKPAKQIIIDNAKFFERVAKEGIVSNEKVIADLKKDYKAPLDELFDLVMKNKKVKLKDAAKKFGVHEGLVEQWARVLQDYELIDVHYPEKGEPLMMKK